MLKRIGSIVLSVVMIFTMAFSAFALPASGLELDIRIEGDATEVRVGDTLTVYVDLAGQMVDLSGFTIYGKYNADVFSITEEKITQSSVEGFMETVVSDAGDSFDGYQIRANWLGVDNVTPSAGEVLKMEFTVLADAELGEQTFSFKFEPTGMLYGLGYLPADQYAQGDVLSDPVLVIPATKASLSAVADKDAVVVGEKVEVTVSVNDYADNWAGLVIEGLYDKDLWTLDEVVPYSFGSAAAVPVIDAENGKVSVGWINAENVVVNTDDFAAFKLILTANAAGDASFNFSFLDGGILSVGANNHYDIKEADTDYVKAADKVDVAVSAPVVKVPAALEIVAVGETNVEVGDEVTAKVLLKNYQDNFAGLTLEFSYVQEALDLIEVLDLGFGSNDATIVIDEAVGVVRINWVDAENITAEDTIELVTLRFKALEANAVSINAYFYEDGVISIGENGEYVTLVEEEDFTVETGSLNIDIEDAEVIIPPSLSLSNGGETEIVVGENYGVGLELSDYADDWATITIEGTFDASKLQLQEFVAEGAVEPIFVVDNEAGTYSLVYMNETAVELDDSFLGTLMFKGFGAGESKITANFKDGGILVIGPDGEYIAKEAGADYEKFANELTVTVARPVVPSKTILEVQINEDLSEVEVGQPFEVSVLLKNYKDNWAAITAEGIIDPELFEIVGVTPAAFGEATAIPVIDPATGRVSVSFINATNIDADADGLLFTLSLKAKAQGAGAFQFQFKDGGVISVNENGEYLTLLAGPTFESTSNQVGITVGERQPNAAPYLKAAIAGGATSVEKGETITVTVDVNEYADDWAGFAIEGSFNKDLFELTSATPATFGANNATVVIDNANGKVGAGWFNAENVDAEIEFTALTLVFTAKAAGEAAFNFNFKDEGVISINPEGGYDTLVPEIDYVKGAEEINITVTDSTPPVVVLPSLKANIEAFGGMVGEEFIFTMNLSDYAGKWASFTAQATFNPALFEVINVAPAALGDATAVPVIDNVNGIVSVTFINATNIEANAGVPLATITVRAKAAGEDTFAISFKDGSVISVGENGEYNTLIAGTDYSDSVAEIEATIEAAPVAPAVKPTVSIKNNQTTVKQGETVTLVVGVENYTELLTGISLGGAFDPAVFEVTDISAETLEGLTVTPVINANEYKVVFFGAEGYDANASAFKLFEVTLKAKDNATLGATDLGICFLDDGMADADGNVLATDKYVADRQTVSVTIEEAEQQECQHDWSGTPVHDDNTSGATSKHIYTCTLGCGATKSEGCSFKETNRVPADCDTAEKITYTCEGCGYSYTVEGDPATDHDWNGKPAHDDNTSGATSKHVYTCGNGCGETKVEDCTLVETNRVPATCTTAEKITYTCSACDYSYTVDGDPATDHDWSGKPVHDDNTVGATSKHVYTCGNGCGETKVEDCTLVETNRVPATCTTAEKITYTCSACDYSYTVDGDPATDHDWSGKPAHDDNTVGAASKHVYTCGNGCGETKVEDCTLVETNRVPATCTTAEKITYTCSACDYSYTVDGDPATDHDWSGKPVHDATTEGAASKHIYTCANGCGETKAEGCSFTTTVFDASCAEEGYTLHTCDKCGYSYKDNFVPGTEHTNIVTRYYAPSSDKNGHIGWIDHFCYDCYHAVREGEQGYYKVIPAGHPFKDVTDASAWYYDAVTFCKAFGVFSGDQNGAFNPTRAFTRGQMVVVLGKIMAPEVGQMTDAQFKAFLNSQTSLTGLQAGNMKDIKGTYYERYALLLGKWGIVMGSTDGNFYGNNTITRQEMAAMFKRFVDANGASNATFGPNTTFKDIAKVDSWAKDNVLWAGRVGLFQGDANKNYNPKANASTAEVAVVLYKMIPVLQNIEIIK